MQREVSWPVAVLSLAQAITFLTAAVIAILWGVSWAAVTGMLVLGALAIQARIRGGTSRGSRMVGWFATLFTWGALIAHLEEPFGIQTHHLVVAGLLVAGGLIAAQKLEQAEAQPCWRAMALVMALMASASWLAGSYLACLYRPFHWAVAATVGSLVALRVFLRLPGAVIQVVHTLILLLVALPIADRLTRPSYELDTSPETVEHYYSFEAAKEDPSSFARWWQHFMDQWGGLHKALAIEDEEGLARYRMLPNSEARIFESVVKINSLGFRGPEIKVEKNGAYRIVALGESTTFGCTIREDGKPWPRLLEEKLRARLKPKRRIEVINAGIYGLTLEENVRRLEKRILRLKPDMVISYHGYNYFHALNKAIPPPTGRPLPRYELRPLKLLADFEYQIKIRAYKRERAAMMDLARPIEGDPMKTAYAKAYRDLIALTRKHHIKLVVANFSMAVNAHSEREVIEFYRAGFPSVLRKIQANRIHSEIVERLTQKNPEIIFVDTHPPLDGQHEKFIDLVHFTQAGREELAETFYDAIQEEVAKQAKKPARPEPSPTLITEAATDEEAG